MEHKIGEIFEYNGEWYQCVKAASCGECDFLKDICINDPNIKCIADDRSDNCSIVFKKLEKVGEPFQSSVFDDRIVMLQSYKMLTIPYISGVVCCIHYDTNIIDIEIKQNKEDMEENNDGNTPLNELTDRYVNGSINYDEFEKEVKALYSCKKEDMKEKKIQHYDCFFDRKPTLKEFDLEAAKAGKPVCTRDGRKVRIICFDKRGGCPIIALVEPFVVEYDCIREETYYYTTDGCAIGKNTESKDNLMMLLEKKEGWVNVYKEDDSYTTSEEIYESKEEAIKSNPYEEAYLTTVKIEWEE